MSSNDEQRLGDETEAREEDVRKETSNEVNQETLVSTIAALQAEVGRLRRTQERASRKPKNFNILREFERVEQLQNSVEAAVIKAPTPAAARDAVSRHFVVLLERLIVVDRAGGPAGEYFAQLAEADNERDLFELSARAIAKGPKRFGGSRGGNGKGRKEGGGSRSTKQE